MISNFSFRQGLLVLLLGLLWTSAAGQQDHPTFRIIDSVRAVLEADTTQILTAEEFLALKLPFDEQRFARQYALSNHYQEHLELLMLYHTFYLHQQWHHYVFLKPPQQNEKVLA